MTPDTRVVRAFFLYVAVLLYLSVGAATLPHLDWYQTLTLPSPALPPVAVSVAWLVVFTASAYSAAAVWRATSLGRTLYLAVAAYGGLLFALVLWNYLFFGARDLDAAYAVAVAITGSVAVLVIAIRRVTARAAYWLLPLLAWMLYATWFNGGLAALNG